MCAFGEPVGAQEALALGIVDAIIEGDLLAGAIAFAREAAAQAPARNARAQRETARRRSRDLRRAPAQQAAKTRRGQTAPLAAIDAVEAATRCSFEAGCAREAELFDRVPLSDAVQGPDPRLLRRARRRQNSRTCPRTRRSSRSGARR